MAIRFLDSFSHYSTAQIFSKWTSDVQDGFGARTIIQGAGRCKQSCLQLAANTIGAGDGPGYHPPFANLTEGVLEAGFQIVGGNDGNPAYIFAIYQNGLSFGSQVAGLGLRNNGTLEHIRGFFGSGGQTIVGRTVKAIQDTSWHHIALQFKMDPVNGVFNIYVDGDLANPWYTFTGNTGASGYTDFSVLRYNGINGGGTTMRMCDFFWGDQMTDLKGDSRVYARLPSADGTNLSWTPAIAGPHYLMVNSNPATDTTKYNATLTIGAKDTYKYPAIGIPSGTVYAVQVNPRMFKTDVGFRAAQPVIRQDGVDYIVGSANAVADGQYLFYPQCFETDPTSATWDVNHAVNDEFGEILIG